MPESVETFDGWYALHDFRNMDWEKWQLATESEQQAALEEFSTLLEQWQDIEDAKRQPCTVLHCRTKADLMFMVLRPSMKDINILENQFNKTAMAHYTQPVYSYVSIIEKSTYSKRETDPYKDPAMLEKLYPVIPKSDYICFYPMSKSRGEINNWFTLPKEERGRMMYEHIATSKPYTQDIKRIITGSIGLDDYEWGVSLFCDDPLRFKKLIYDTRFDEVSAKYAIFGSFYIGHLLPANEIHAFFK